MDDRVLALCELSNDLLFSKIPKERLCYYADTALAAGRDTAKSFSGQDVQSLYQQNGIEIHYTGSGKQNYGIVLRGQSVMDKTHCSVDLYQDSIHELAAHSAWKGHSLTTEQALNVHLAHEFFHIWEYQNGRSVVEQLEPIISASFLWWRRRAHINRCGEVAAHAFAKELLGLPFLPNFYDYRYLIDTGRMSQEDFDRLAARMSALCSLEGNTEQEAPVQ